MFLGLHKRRVRFLTEYLKEARIKLYSTKPFFLIPVIHNSSSQIGPIENRTCWATEVDSNLETTSFINTKQGFKAIPNKECK